MKKIILFIISVLYLTFTNVTNAHPLDISVSTWNIKWNIFSINTYFHTFEIEYLLKNNWINPDWVIDYFENENIIIDYIKEKTIFKNNWKACEIQNIIVNRDEAYDIITNWLSTNYEFKCEENIQKFILELNFFLEFRLQTNRITIYDLNNGIRNLRPIIFKVLNPKIYFLELDLNNLNVVRIDSDWDWLSDEEELIYWTDPFNIDTDWDNYTDYEEIMFWWDPLDPNPGPWQEYRESLDIQLSIKKIDELERINLEMAKTNLSDYWYNNGFLKKVMKYINDYFERWEWNLFIIFVIVFILWILHAAWPWHSKWLLIAYTLEKENWYKKGFIFALIFSITHIIDIIILFLIVKFIFHFIDVNDYIYYVQLISAILLFIISIFLIYKSVKKVQKCKNKDLSLSVAFLAWLTPCSFAWSIFLLLAALWKTSWIFPLVIALWLWILATLIFIVIISVYLKNKAYEKVGNIWKYSSLISSIIIFLISLVLIYNLI